MANNAIIGARIKQVREEKGLTQEELANVLGLNKSTIQRYETAKIEKIKLPIVEAIAQLLDVNPEWISDKTDIRIPYNTPEQSETKLKKIPYTKTGTVLVPLVGRVAAGYSCYAEENITEYIRTDEDTIKTGYDYFWLEVKGDSMEPELHEKDLVLVREQETLENTCYAVVTIDSEDGLVKLVNVDYDKITLTSINPYYPPRVFEKEEMNRVKIIGQVIEIKRRLY